jgi:alkyldihydroxyacetonephosphate synthase
MRRWNGWGEERIDFPLPENAYRFLADKVGEAVPLPDAKLADVLVKLPESRLPDHPLVIRKPQDRVCHARGQSLPDWLALKSGNLGTTPDAVAYPITVEEILTLLEYAKNNGAVVIPYGGGTSVVGHITPERSKNPVLTIDMGRMNRLLSLDDESRIATFGAGAAGPDIEAQLRARGYTLGHFPQSFEFSTLGGWIATRSTGQESLRYGRIEQLFAGGRLVSPAGILEIPAFPASSAGLDLRELVLGSEGRMGILSQVKVRVTRLPKHERFQAIFFPSWKRGLAAARRAVRAGIPLSMLRLSNPAETQTQLVLAGHGSRVKLLEKFLSRRGAGPRKCMLIFGVTGTYLQCNRAARQARGAFQGAVGFLTSRYLGMKWEQNRFRTPYLRNTLWEKGYAVDTVESATNWDKVERLADVMESALIGALSRSGERVHAFSHLSHLYPQGASIYTTYISRVAETYDKTLTNWQDLKAAVSKAIVANGGTISHQHGVGVDHAPYLEAEKGRLGIDAIKVLCRQFDPHGIMNPGKLVR